MVARDWYVHYSSECTTPNWQVDAPEFITLGQYVVQTNKWYLDVSVNLLPPTDRQMHLSSSMRPLQCNMLYCLC